MIDLDEIFLNILQIFLVELKFIFLYCINRINSGHRITPGHLRTYFFYKLKHLASETRILDIFLIYTFFCMLIKI